MGENDHMNTNVLTIDKFRTLVIGMKTYYPQENFIPTENAFLLWYDRLEDIPYDILQAAIHMHVESSTFPPTIAELRKKASRLSPAMQAEFPEPEEVVAILDRATSRAAHYAEEEFAKLPKVIQKLVGSADNLRSYGLMDGNDAKQIITNRVSKMYENMVAREKEERRYTPQLRQLLSEVDEHAAKKELCSKKEEPKLLPCDEARKRFEGLEGYDAPKDDEFSKELFRRYGNKAPKKGDK